MKIAAIIPTFNRKEYLKILLSQLQNQNREDFTIEIIVVVDGSNDGTYEMLNNYFPEVHIVKGTGDWWYTKSMNEGFKYAEKFKPDYVLILNDDVEIGENYIQQLLNGINKLEKNSIIGSICFTLKKPCRVTSSGVRKISRLSGRSITYYKFGDEVDPDKLSGMYLSEVLPGRGTLIPTKVLKELNYFDEYFKQYLSDFDFCLRAKEKGYKIYISWNAKVFSHVDKTSYSSSYKRFSLSNYLSSFVDVYSRNHILQRIIYFWRHRTKVFLPLSLSIWLLAVTRANLCKKKI